MAELGAWDTSAFWEQDNPELGAIPSGFEIACGDEALVENVATPETSKFLTEQLTAFMKRKTQAPDPTPGPTDANSTLYQLTPPHHIRVLKLGPGPMDAPLIATLEQISVEFDYTRDSSGWRLPCSFGISFIKQKKVPYTAISYCWGDDNFIRPITVSGHSKMITITLDGILRHLRDPEKEVTLWADQLCINQQSPADQESQVKLMGMVYTKSRNTVIWLGKEPGKEAFKALQGLSQATMGSEELLDEELKHLRRPKGEDAETMLSLRALLRQPWFQRTWIIQEAVLSRELYLMAGRDTISWEDFAGYCMGIHDLGIFDDEFDVKGKSGLAVAAEIYSAKNYSDTSNGTESMFRWLVDTRYAGVEKPVDKVYGVLGLCDSDVVPDYSKPKEKLYGEVALHEVKQAVAAIDNRIAAGDQDLRMVQHNMTSILACIDHDTDPGTSKLSSWVPDWSKPRITVALAYRTSCLAHYRPGNTNGQAVFRISESDMIIHVLAKPQDKITQLSEVFNDPHLSLQDPLNTNATLQNCIDFLQQPHPAKPSISSYFSNSQFWHSFCSTLVAGKDDIEGKNTCSEAYTEIFSFFCDQLSTSTPGQTYTARQKRPAKRGVLTFEHFQSGKNGRTFRALNTALRNALKGRRLCWTEKGFVALVGGFAKGGDQVLTVPGCAVPFVMRRAENGGENIGEKRYTLVGESYVHGLVEDVRKDFVPSDAMEWVSIV
ncbi:hypothetical protein CB0940_11954 [Cercospora beticola]|uniref:Heterokaryon incompatibility domain-containing protein n=1 Tax=Cercospora beticola TaxID=122368 RepID=A0A2G5IE86_CERBT|nr:hypothetical protein CB0940_11954 [Cercospora beticola]PIB03089.1 hypothetical protein CB0940_11954 [Cercospora beticola]WPB04321.1 hypothetical protein RHO25_008967 [Cercospora beticola]